MSRQQCLISDKKTEEADDGLYTTCIGCIMSLMGEKKKLQHH